MNYHLMLYLAALFCFVFAAFGASVPKVSLVPLGLALLTATLVF